MKKIVSGQVTATVYKVVEIPDEQLRGMDEYEIEQEFIDKAHDDFGGIYNFAGNGGTDKIVGVYGEDESIDIGDEIEFDKVEEYYSEQSEEGY